MTLENMQRLAAALRELGAGIRVDDVAEGCRSTARPSPCGGAAGAAAAGHRAARVLGHRLAAAPGLWDAEQGTSFGHAKIAGGALLRRGLPPQITTLSTATAPPVIAEARLRPGKAGSGRAAARQVKQAIGTARACRATGTIMLRGDSASAPRR